MFLGLWGVVVGRVEALHARVKRLIGPILLLVGLSFLFSPMFLYVIPIFIGEDIWRHGWSEADKSKTKREPKFYVRRFLGLDHRTTARIGRICAGLALLSWITLGVLEFYVRPRLPGASGTLFFMPYLEVPLIALGAVSTITALNW